VKLPSGFVLQESLAGIDDSRRQCICSGNSSLDAEGSEEKYKPLLLELNYWQRQMPDAQAGGRIG
jgi:hypothetical protein